jgi:hypothetical protein
LIQRARKSADFNVEDRIEIQIFASPELTKAILQNKQYIEDETLATIVETLSKPAEYKTDVMCEGEKVEFFLAR